MSINKILDRELDTVCVFARDLGPGEIGIEIETEGVNLPTNIERYWNAIPDHSLRGEALEYILKKPIGRNALPDALDYFQKAINKPETMVNDSYRTSVHIHLNNKRSTFRQIFNHICLYLIFEDMLVDFCGKSRTGNVFCLRARDAEYMIDELCKVARSGNVRNLGSDNLRYSAINLKALIEHGSLEFRSFRGTTDIDLIQQWIQILLDLKDAAYKFKNPREMLETFSVNGPQALFEQTFENTSHLLNFSESAAYSGARYAQEIAYTIPNWDAPAPATIKGIAGTINGAAFAVAAGGGGGGVIWHDMRQQNLGAPEPILPDILDRIVAQNAADDRVVLAPALAPLRDFNDDDDDFLPDDEDL